MRLEAKLLFDETTLHLNNRQDKQWIERVFFALVRNAASQSHQSVVVHLDFLQVQRRANLRQMAIFQCLSLRAVTDQGRRIEQGENKNRDQWSLQQESKRPSEKVGVRHIDPPFV